LLPSPALSPRLHPHLTCRLYGMSHPVSTTAVRLPCTVAA
jgi:hypothetical protein